jgi:TetR/AcrR family transcriptional regulator, transcriptional repressor of aconitase
VAARRLFGERGFARTTTADVVAASGLSNGAVYHYFPSKVELVVAVSAGHDGTVDGVAPKEPAVRLMNRLIDYVNPDIAHDHARLAAQIWGEASVVPRLAAVVRETHVGLQEQFADALARDGAVGPRSDQMSTAQVCLAAIIGLAALVGSDIEVDLPSFREKLRAVIDPESDRTSP